MLLIDTGLKYITIVPPVEETKYVKRWIYIKQGKKWPLLGWTLKTCWIKEACHKGHIVCFHLYEMSQTGKSIEMERQSVVARG